MKHAWGGESACCHLKYYMVIIQYSIQVPSKQLRSIIGCDLQGTADERTEERLKQNGYNISKFPNCTKALVTEFPYRTTFSIWIAVKRVYPGLMKYIKVWSSSGINIKDVVIIV